MSLVKVKKQETPRGQELSRIVCDVLDQNKAENILAVDLTGKSVIADVMVIASGTSQRHLLALADKVKEALHKIGVSQVRIEGGNTSDWILLDGGDIIVHLFKPETRLMYNLEKMWDVDFKSGS